MRKVTWAMMHPLPVFSARFSALLALIWGTLVWINWLAFNPVSFGQIRTALHAYTRVDWAAAPQACAGHALSAGGMLLLILAALGAGRWLVLLLRERGIGGGLLPSCALGAGVLSLAVLGLGFAGLSFPGPAWILVAGSSIYGVYSMISLRKPKPTCQWPGPEWRTAGAVWLIAGIVLAIFIALTGALAPARAYDALFHHLAHPRIFAEHHKVIGLPHHFLSYYPALLEMQYLMALLLGGGLGFAKLIHFFWGMFVLAVLFRWARESLPVPWALAAVSGFVLLPYVQLVFGWGYVDLGAAGYLTLALWLVCGKRLHPVTLGIICGFCAGTKAGGVFAVILVGGMLAVRRLQGWRFLACLAVFGLVALPWGVRNWAVSGNPFAPFLSGVFPTLHFGPANMARYHSELTSYSDHAQASGEALSLLALPWNASIRNFGVLDARGGMSGWFLFVLPCLFFFPARAARIPAILSGAYFLLWLAIPRQVRYLLPIWPAAALAGVHAVREMAQRGGLAALCAFGSGAVLVLQLLAALQRQYYAADPLRVVFGSETQDEYLERGIGGRPHSVWAMQWLRRNLAGERVLIVSDFALGTLWGPKVVFQSAFDTPLIERFSREAPDPEGMAKKFRQLKIKYVLYGTVGGFPMQREYRIFNFDEGSAARWRRYWQECSKPIYNQNDRYIVYTLACSHPGGVSTLPGLDEQALAEIDGDTRRLEKSGRLHEALPGLVEEYGEIASKWESPLAFEQLGWALLEMKRTTAARAALNRADRMGRDSASFHFVQGMLDGRDDDLAGAIRRYRRCLELDPMMREARLKLVETLIQLGRHEQAREVIAQGLKLEPGAEGIAGLAKEMQDEESGP